MSLSESNVLKKHYSCFYNSKVKDDIKLLVISDIHITNMIAKEQLDLLNKQIAKEEPNYIFVLGDIIDCPTFLRDSQNKEKVITFLKNLSSITKTLAVLGNHDFIIKNHLGGFYNINPNVWNEIVDKSSVDILIDSKYEDDNVNIFGGFQSIDYYHENKNRACYINNIEINNDLYYHEPVDNYDNYKAFYKYLEKNKDIYENLSKDKPNIGLFHSPDYAMYDKNIDLLSDYDLLISGHYHNGCLPIILDDIIKSNRGLIGPKKAMFPKIARGIINLGDNTHLVINGGITKLAESTDKLFFLNFLFYQDMDIITLTNDKDKKNVKVKTKRVNIKKY